MTVGKALEGGAKSEGDGKLADEAEGVDGPADRARTEAGVGVRALEGGESGSLLLLLRSFSLRLDGLDELLLLLLPVFLAAALTKPAKPRAQTLCSEVADEGEWLLS